MEEDDEIHSHPTSASGSPASPRDNGRITVTVAAPPPSAQTTINLALPVQQPKSGGGGREDCWSEGATAVLIDAWGERYMELSRGNLKQKHWKEVADIVTSREDYTKTPKTDIQCKNRIDTVKKKYKLEKSKISAGGALSKWPFYERLEGLIGSTTKTVGSGVVVAGTATPSLQSQKVPVGIPVGIRSANQYHQVNRTPQQQKGMRSQKIQLGKRSRLYSDSSGSDGEISPASSDSFPPDIYERKMVKVPKELNPTSARVETPTKGRNGAKEKGYWGNGLRELTQAILKFGEAYEKAERAKVQQVVEMEKQRMKFAKDLELQRMQFFMETQVEISQLKQGKRAGNTSSNHRSNKNGHNRDSTN